MFGAAVAGLLSAAAFAGEPPVVTTIVIEGDTPPGLGTVTRIDNVGVNNGGASLVEVATTNNAGLLRNGGLVAREGGPVLNGPIGATIASFDSVNLNDSLFSSLNLTLNGTSGSGDDSGLFVGVFQIIQESDGVAAPTAGPGWTYAGFFETTINNPGFHATVLTINENGPLSRALMLFDPNALTLGFSEQILAKAGDIPAGQTQSIADLGTGPHSFALNDNNEVIYVVDLNGTLSVDTAIYVNDTLVAQEGSPSPVMFRDWDFATPSAVSVDINESGNYLIRGVTDGDPLNNELLARGSSVVAREGFTQADISPFTITSFGIGAVQLADNDKAFYYAAWNDPDTTRNEGILRDNELIVQEGVTMIDGFVLEGISSGQDNFVVSDNGRYIVFEGTINGGLNAAFLVDLGDQDVLPCPGDLVPPEGVDTEDLLLLINDWGCTGPPGACVGDIAEPFGIVDADDLLLLVNSWGACPTP